MMGLSGSMIPMLWPKAQEFLADICSDKKFQGATVTINSDGLQFSLPTGEIFSISPDTDYNAAIAMLGEVMGNG